MRNCPFLSNILDNQFQTQFRGWAPRFHTWLNYPPARALRPINPNNACTLRITAAAGTKLAGASFKCTVKIKAYWSLTRSSTLTELYRPKPFLTHAALLRQTFVHCAIFPTAASRRSLDRVSVPVWPINLSIRLDIVAMVGRYPTIKLMSRRPIPQRMHCKEASFQIANSNCYFVRGIS